MVFMLTRLVVISLYYILLFFYCAAALVWQLMRAYTLAVLRDLTQSDKPVVDQDIVNWANQKLASSNKTSRFESFKDPALSDGRVVIDLIDSIVPGCIRYDLVRQAESDEVSQPFCTTGYIDRLSVLGW